MGLIKAIIGSAIGTIADEWLEYIYCDSMPGDVLMKKGQARAGAYSGNTGGDSNIISDGSKIAINEGQCMLIVENGRIVDFSSEPGGYIYNTGTEPSMFDNSEYGLRDSFQKMGKRFMSGGQAMNDQRVYFINKKEIMDNRIGAGKIPFRDGEFNLTLMLKAFGTYSFRIVDPIVFYTNVCANVSDEFLKESIEKQLRAELQSALLPVLGSLAAQRIRYDEIPLKTDEIVKGLNAQLGDAWRAKRGLAIDTLVINNVVPDDSSIQKIRELQESSIYANQTSMLGARIGAAQANAMQDAANNSNGAMTGFMGMNMAMGGGGINANALLQPQQGYSNQQQMQDAPTQQPVQQTVVIGQSMEPNYWTCSCGAKNALLYCQECGKKKPDMPKPWKCECGQENTKKFCGACGRPKPKRYICDKCGYELDPAAKPPKFCPQCGDPIDEADEVKE